MLIRQSINSYIRCTENYGYITNQLTRLDRVYNNTGAFFLRHISRNAICHDSIIAAAIKEFGENERDVITADLLAFIQDLEINGFIVTGENEDELNKKDVIFSYSSNPSRILADRFEQSMLDNVHDNTQDYFLEEVQGRPLISAIQFELTSRCNERCIHCYIPSKKKDNGIDMPYELIKSVLNEFSSMGGIHVTLSGGEAFLHKDILDICDYCRAKDLKISILSNLIGLTDSHIERLKRANIALIQTSLYSMDPSIHDSITTVRGSFKKTKEAIERLVAADIPVQISCPLMKANFKGYKEVLDYARSLKIKAQTDYIMMAQADLDPSNLANRLSLNETEQVIRDIIENDIEYQSITLNQKSLESEVKFDIDRFKRQPVCGVGYDNCCITANGDVYPCAGWQDYVLGNVHQQSLSEIWEKSNRVKELRTITQASFPQCIECEALSFCNRCLVRNYNESNGDMFNIPKHFCDVAFLNKRLVEEYELKLEDKIYTS